jgi:energy-coupling factor transporter ATP-binding protein EcfA2
MTRSPTPPASAGQRPELVISRLALRRLPGLTKPFELTSFSPGLNVVYGPNASGKTTTARAIGALLWPHTAWSGSISLAGQFALAGEEWRADLDAGRVRYQRAGNESNAPVLPPAEARDRYQLSLHDLLSADNGDLAREILRESAGGYDLGEAAKALKARYTPSRALRESEALREGREALIAARARHEELRRDEERLIELHERAVAAERAAERLRLLDSAIQHAEAVSAVEISRRELALYPKEMAGLLGDEGQRLAAIRSRLGKARERLALAEQRRAEAAAVIRGAGLPLAALGPDSVGSPIAPPAATLHPTLQVAGRGDDSQPSPHSGGTIMPALRQWIEGVRTLEHALDAAEVACERAATRRAEARRTLGEGSNDARLRQIDLPAMEALATFAHESGTAQAEHAAARAWLAALGEDRPPEDLERLLEGERVLRQWLRIAPQASAGERQLRVLGTLAATLLVVIGLAGGLLLHPVSFGAAAVGVAISLLLLRPTPGSDLRAALQAEYQRLGITHPTSWTEGEVESYLDRLRQAIAAGRAAANLLARREDAAARLRAAEARLEPLEVRRRQLVSRLGVAPGTDAAALYWLADRIGRWQEAESESQATLAALGTIRRQLAAELAAAAAPLLDLGYSAPTSLAELVAAANATEVRVLAHNQGVHERAAGEREHAAALREIAELTDEQTAILKRFGPGANEQRVAQWLAHLEAFTRARNTLVGAEERRRNTQSRLELAAGPENDLLRSDLDELRAALREAASLANEIGEIRSEIGRIESRLEEGRKGHDAETAIAALDRARAELHDLRAADITGMVGGVLVAFLQSATRDQQRPAVFHHARALFARITKGRYRLDFDAAEPPAFRAYDTTTGIGHSLDELSSATRVQLLLAVRIAFIEEQETGARLPLLFDETLGNSDDQRAAAIIDATCALAAEGRQIFYFTAQPDEVAKWRAVLAERSETPASFIDLAEQRRLASYRPIPRVATAPQTAVPTPPPGCGHHQYGELLLVPPIDLHADPGTTHLWHLIEDPEDLYQLLRLGIESWGALEFLAQHDSATPLGLERAALDRATAAALALKTALELARIGRGRPVHREVLSASGAITDTFLDRVDELCRLNKGDPALLLAALESLPRFRAEARDRLRIFFEEQGFLDYRDPIDPALIRLRSLDTVAPEIQAGRITVEQIERLLARLPLVVPV